MSPTPTHAVRGRGGLSPRYWARAIEIQEERLVAVHREMVADHDRDQPAYAEKLQRLHLEAHFLLISVAHLLKSLDTSARFVGTRQIRAIKADFDKRAPWVKHFRDVLEHLDDYVRGKGKLQKEGLLDPRVGPILTFGPFDPPYEVVVMLGRWKLPLRRTAQACVQLGHLLADQWEDRFGDEDPLIIWGRTR